MSEETKVEQNPVEKSDIPKNSNGKKRGLLAVIVVVFISLIVGISIYNAPSNRLSRHLDLGKRYLEEQNYEQAAVEFEKAIKIDPSSVEAYLGLAEAHESMDDYDKAVNIKKNGLELKAKVSILEKVEEINNQLTQNLERLQEQKEMESETDSGVGLTNVNNDVVEVNFERFYEELYEYAIITGMDNSGNVVWTYQTDKYMGAEGYRTDEITVKGDSYYFVEGETIIVLNISDGSVRWKNGSGVGLSAFAFGDDDSLYICGYYGPDFFAVDKDGNTIMRIDSFDSDYYWPYEMEYLGDQVAITFDGTPEYSWFCKTVFYVNLDDYSYYNEKVLKKEVDSIVDQIEHGNPNIVARILNTDNFPQTSHLLVALDNDIILGEIDYERPDVGYWGSIEVGDLTNDGQDEILVNMWYFGSNYGATDVHVYTVKGTDLVEILYLETGEIGKVYPELSAGTGATIEDGCLKVWGLIPDREKETTNIIIKYQDGVWIKANE